MAHAKEDLIRSLVEDGDDQIRAQAQKDRLNVYLDCFKDQVDSMLVQQFHPDNRHLLYKMISTYINPLKKIVNLKSVIYKSQAFREWKKSDTTIEEYTDMIENSNIHSAYQALNKLVNCNNVAFMRVSSDATEGKIKYDAVPSDMIWVIQNERDPYKVDALLRKVDDETYVYWDKEEYLVLDKSLTVVEEQENPYINGNANEGIIPYIPFWNMQPFANDFWNYTANDDLYNLTIQVNVLISHLHNQLKLGTLRQLVLSGLINDDIKKVFGTIVDGISPIALKGEGASVQALQMAADFKEYMDTLRDLISQVVDQHGVSFSSQSGSAQKQSGLALSIEKEALNDLREEQEPLFREGEHKVALASIIISNTDLGTSIDITGKLKVDFARAREVFGADYIAQIDYAVREGYKSKPEAFVMFNPDTHDLKEAEAEIVNNLQINERIGGTDTAGAEITEAFVTQPIEGEEEVETEEETEVI